MKYILIFKEKRDHLTDSLEESLGVKIVFNFMRDDKKYFALTSTAHELKTNGHNSALAADNIRKLFDEKYGLSWTCIVGQYENSIQFVNDGCIKFTMFEKNVCIFQHA